MAILPRSYKWLPLFLVFAVVQGQTVRKYRFEVGYITGSPDGVRVNHILGINGKFPGPLIEAEAGDTLQIDVVNKIHDGQNVTLHWHGILQNGTPFEDGPVAVTQCPIKAGSHQVYTFEVPIAGTYWYHSHVNAQYTEGLWGVLIVRNPKNRDPYRGSYDKEILITLNDWYHTSAADNEKFLFKPTVGASPYPSSGLLNGVGRFHCPSAWKQGRPCDANLQTRPVFRVQRDKTYRIRLVNTAGWTAFNFAIDGHIIRAIEVDGVDTVLSDETSAQAVHIGPGQRYSFLVSTLPTVTVGSQFLIRARIRTDYLPRLPLGANNINPDPGALIPEVTGVLHYTRLGDFGGASPDLVEPIFETFDYTRYYSPAEQWGNLRFVNDADLAPLDGVPAPPEFDNSIELTIMFVTGRDGITRASFNGRPIEYLPGRPQLATFITGRPLPEVNFPVAVKYGELLQIVVNNPRGGAHPIHLHGHHFWVMGMGEVGAGNYDPKRHQHQLNHNGMRRDTAMLEPNSWIVIKFRADNVGVWSLHCHIDWHMLTGMMMTIVEAPELASKLTIPSEARRVCAEHGILI